MNSYEFRKIFGNFVRIRSDMKRDETSNETNCQMKPTVTSSFGIQND